MESSGSSGQIAFNKSESSSFRDLLDEEQVIEGCVHSWQAEYEQRRLKMRPGVEAHTCPLMYSFSKQISARIKTSKNKKRSNSRKIADDSIPVSVAVFAIKPVYEAVFGRWMTTLKRSFWRTFEKIINDCALWNSDDWNCATIFLEKTNIGEIAILRELKSEKKEDLRAYFLKSMFKFMKTLFLKVFFVTREKNKVLVFHRQTWNKLVKNHLKARIDNGWFQEVPKEKVKSIRKNGIKLPIFGFIPSGEKFRIVAPLKQHLLRVEPPLVRYRDSENMKIRERTASQDDIKEIFSAKLQFIRWIAVSDSITNIQSISLPDVLPFMQKIDTSSCVLAKTDVRSAYDGILVSKAYNCFLGKLNNFFGDNEDSQERYNFRWIFFRKSEQSGKFEYKRKEEISIFDEEEYKCFRVRDIEKLLEFLKQTPIRWGKKHYSPRFLLHSSPLSFPLAELFIKDTLNVAYKKANIPNLQIIQYMDDILILGQSKEQISTFYDALKTLLPMHGLSLDEITFLGYNKNLTTNAVTKKIRRQDPIFTKRMKAPLRERINYFQFLAKNKLTRSLWQKIIIELDEKSTKQVVFAVFQEIARCYNATRKHVHLQNNQLQEFRRPEEFFHKCFGLVNSRLVNNEKRFFNAEDFGKLKRSFLRITSK